MASAKTKLPRSARPKRAKAATRGERLELRLTATQKQLLASVSLQEGKSLSAFVLESALSAARGEAVVRLSGADSRKVVELLLNPRRPNQAATEAARSYQRARTR
ncbi:MAG: DUF1778 domain-containing protein [Planctomycetes bacterium]|nr:DUF1778 domain-containing protein [Planctomycetota bacterium]